MNQSWSVKLRKIESQAAALASADAALDIASLILCTSFTSWIRYFIFTTSAAIINTSVCYLRL